MGKPGAPREKRQGKAFKKVCLQLYYSYCHCYLSLLLFCFYRELLTAAMALSHCPFWPSQKSNWKTH